MRGSFYRPDNTIRLKRGNEGLWEIKRNRAVQIECVRLQREIKQEMMHDAFTIWQDM
jgi:hypothetical protein